jgi:hypothetical protein
MKWERENSEGSSVQPRRKRVISIHSPTPRFLQDNQGLRVVIPWVGRQRFVTDSAVDSRQVVVKAADSRLAGYTEVRVPYLIEGIGSPAQFFYDKELRRSSEAPQPREESTATRIELTSLEGQEKIRAALERSRGSALAVIHPFPETGNELTDPAKVEYDWYVRGLRSEVQRKISNDVPVILFEWQYGMTDVQKELARLGISDGEVFIVPTVRDSTPEPATGTLREVAHQLKTNGLEEITVAGSYLWLKDRTPLSSDISSTVGLPTIAQKYDIEGCVGYTMQRFLEAGITTNPGSTFSGQSRTVPQRESQEHYGFR